MSKIAQHKEKAEKNRVVELVSKAPKDYTVLCGLNEIYRNDENNIHEWRQCARWIRFEEDVEASGLRWSKPYVASLSSFCMFQVKNLFNSSLLILDAEERTWPSLIKMIAHKLKSDGTLNENEAQYFENELKLPIMHLYKRVNSSKVLPKSAPTIKSVAQSLKEAEDDEPLESQDTKFDESFMKKISPGTEAINVFVGATENISTTTSIIVRMKRATLFPDVTEVPVPSRIIAIILGREDNMIDYKELGKSIGTLMADEIFRKVAIEAETRQDLIIGIDEFISSSTMLPPSEWENNIRLEPPSNIPNPNDRIQILNEMTSFSNASESSSDSDNEEKTPRPKSTGAQVESPPISQSNEKKKYFNRRKKSDQGEDHTFDESLKMTNRLFGGLREDLKRKAPFYLSDFRDALDVKCFASFFFLYFACLAPIVTFGGLLYQETGGYLGTMESLFSGALVGVLFALFSGQPLIILGSTGPVLIFEKILYTLCKTHHWNYLSFRLWVGLWIALFLFIMVAFDLSALVKYVTRFTEESFAALIAFIFIIKAIEKLIDIHKYYEVDLSWDPSYRRTIDHCYCNAPTNKTELQIMEEYIGSGKPMDFPKYKINASNLDDDDLSNWRINWTDIGEGRYTWKGFKYTKFCESLSGTWTGNKCDKFFAPDIFFFSCLLCFGTFIIAMKLKSFNSLPFFRSIVRKFISDFSVVMSILIMTLTDYFLGLHTLKLNVPEKFEPTLGFAKRGWYVPFFNGNPWWTSLVAFGPALLGALLIFMDQQITAVIVNRKVNKLRKGGGYHLDLLIVTITIVTNSFLGIPYFVAATVLSMNHVLSLKIESKIKTPGEKPKFHGCIEQRVTALLIFITMGFSVFMTPVLKRIPMAVLYGIFLYMGVVALKEISMFWRFLLIFIPVKHQPDYKYLRHIRLSRVHLFTIIQVGCFALLLAIKSIPEISILFPIMVFAMCFIRKLLDYVFTQYELKYLDSILPPIRSPKCCCKKKKADILKETEVFVA